MNITLHGISFDKEFAPFLEQLIAVLLNHDANIFLSPMFLHALEKLEIKAKGCQLISSPQELSSMDFVISVGGDGTLLDTVSYVGALEIPMIGINTGRMGFLATIAKEDIEKAIEVLFSKQFTIEDRTLISLDTDLAQLLHRVSSSTAITPIGSNACAQGCFFTPRECRALA